MYCDSILLFTQEFVPLSATVLHMSVRGLHASFAAVKVPVSDDPLFYGSGRPDMALLLLVRGD